jgi:DNA-binding LacI/PurR family transcriptional regulator
VRQRVRELARALDYHPNGLARGLKGHGSRTIGLIIPDLLNDFYAQSATIIQATLVDEGYRLMLGVSGNDVRTELAYLRAMHEQRVEGLIWVPRAMQREALGALAGEGVPVIQFARTSSHRLDGVVADDRGGASAATRHLIELGHRRIGHLADGAAYARRPWERTAGYRRAMADARLEVPAEWIVSAANTLAGGDAAMRRLLQLPGDRPTAVFAFNDQMAIGALHALRTSGLRVPQDMAIVGFDGIGLGAFTSPELTTIEQPRTEVGQRAVAMVLDALEGESSSPTQVTLPVRLVVRESCGASSIRGRTA